MKKLVFLATILSLHFVEGWSGAFAQTANQPGSGNALSFNGIADRLDMISLPVYDFGTNDFSLETWLKSTDVSDYHIAISRINGCFANTGFTLQVQQTSGFPAIYMGTIALVGNKNVHDGDWHHIAAIRKSDTLKIFIDGILSAARGNVVSQNATANNSPQLRIGALNNYTPCNPTAILAPYSGQIDEVRVWNRALTQTEIQTNMCKKLADNYGNGLVGYWRFDEGIDNTCTGGQDACDASGNGNNGVKY